MAGKPGRSGGARLGAGRKPKAYHAAVAAGEIRPREVCGGHVFQDTPCFVYIVHEVEHPAVCKIGLARNPAKRFSHLQVGTWRELMLAYKFVFQTERAAYDVEKLVHQGLSAAHRRGEWFAVSADDAAERIFQAARELDVLMVGWAEHAEAA